MKTAATTSRTFRTFLLVTQFEAQAIGARIARARDEAGLTQEELSEMASFSKRSLQDYEAGNTIPYRHMREISALLARDVQWFLHGEPEQGEDVVERLDRVGSRLEALEALVRESVELTREALELLREAGRRENAAPLPRRRAS